MSFKQIGTAEPVSLATGASRRHEPTGACAEANASGVPMATEFRSAHLVGICGAGMKSLAELLIDLGWTLSGSDLRHPTPAVRSMQERGLRVHQGHDLRFLAREADVLVYSPAVGRENPELRMAERLGIPALSYGQMLAYLMGPRTGVSVAGTHGKSTTTAMTAAILCQAGLSPSAVIGAELRNRETSGWAGSGELLVVESCEYQRSFLWPEPTYGAILGIEPDHFDCFAAAADLCSAFSEFAGRVRPNGLLLVNRDCRQSVKAAAGASAAVTTFSLECPADWWAADLRPTPAGTRFRVFHRGEFFAEISLPVPGTHNVRNALAAAALASAAGASAAAVREALGTFPGVRRRYERVGSWRGMTLLDDYAHHPTAIAATLQTARRRFGTRRIWCAFQPHQVSRTVALMSEFAGSFRSADKVLVAPAFAAREQLRDEPDDVARELADRILLAGQDCRFCRSLDRIVSTVEDEALPGDVLITMGAGDIDRVHHELTRGLQRDCAGR